jgi:SAM-dependent methyltransferase
MGKDVKGGHLQVFILGSAVCGVAGAMMTTLDSQLVPGTYQPLRFTFLIWVMVIVGGSGNNWGAVLGGFLIWLIGFLELLWGRGWLSPGGPEELARLLQGEDLEGRHVLDIGCGAGGIDCLLVSEYGAANVTGIDVEAAVLETARERIREAGVSDRIDLVHIEPGPLPFGDWPVSMWCFPRIPSSTFPTSMRWHAKCFAC